MLETINRFFKKHPKLSYASLIIFLIAVEVGFSYCSKKKCDGFVDINFDNWFPYKDGQVLYYQSNKNDRDTFSELTVFKSAPFETGGGYSSGICDANAEIKNNQYASPDHFYLNYYKSGQQNNSDHLGLILKNVSINANGLNDSGLIINNYGNGPKIKTDYYATYNFNGTNYNKLQVIENDTTGTKTNTVYKIWIAKDIGILGYESYPSFERWVKQ